jgi:hypothetical protein
MNVQSIRRQLHELMRKMEYVFAEKEQSSRPGSPCEPQTGPIQDDSLDAVLTDSEPERAVGSGVEDNAREALRGDNRANTKTNWAAPTEAHAIDSGGSSSCTASSSAATAAEEHERGEGDHEQKRQQQEQDGLEQDFPDFDEDQETSCV